jgi:hypothetical protein
MDGELDLAGGGVGWRLPFAGACLVIAVLVLIRWRVPGAGAATRGLDGLAALAMAFERWVLEAFAGAFAALVVAAAWVADVLDRDVLDAPGDAVARRVVRVAGAVRPVVGGSIARVTWTLIALLATTGVVHSAWPGR